MQAEASAAPMSLYELKMLRQRSIGLPVGNGGGLRMAGRVISEGSNKNIANPARDAESEAPTDEYWWLPNLVTPRLQLRFIRLIDKEPPVGMMFLDEAMDLLGRNMFPDNWGLTVVWKMQPFRFEGRSRNYYRYRPYKDDVGGWRLERLKVHDGYNPVDLQDAATTYRAVIAKFREAAESGAFLAQYADSADALKEIGPARWSVSLLSIFYTGNLFDGRTGGRPLAIRLAPVLIHAASFKQWLESPRRGSRRKATPALLKKIVRELAALAEARDTQYTKPWLWNVFAEAAVDVGLELSELQFIDAVWKSPELHPYHAPPGKPTRKHREAWSTLRIEVKDSILQYLNPSP